MKKVIFTERRRLGKGWNQGSSELWQVKGIVNIFASKKESNSREIGKHL